MKKVKLIFLGGTCNGSLWREQLIPQLDMTKLSCFNPVVKDWNQEAQENEIRMRGECDICLYVITPKMTGVLSIAEAVDDSNKRPEKTVFVALPEYEGEVFSTHQFKSLVVVMEMIRKNGGKSFHSIPVLVDYLNNL